MYLTRHKDSVEGVDLQASILIIGAGSIGSYATLALAKVGFSNITVIDDGMVEEENIAPQFFTIKQMRKAKVEALKSSIKLHTNSDITAIKERVTELNIKEIFSVIKPKVVISALDSMDGRKQILYGLSRVMSDCYLFLDARMSIQFLSIISLDPYLSGHREWYSKTLFSDENAVQEACTNKAISYTSLIAGALICKYTIQGLKQVNESKSSEKRKFIINYDLLNDDLLKI
jgi:hypothetical protein